MTDVDTYLTSEFTFNPELVLEYIFKGEQGYTTFPDNMILWERILSNFDVTFNNVLGVTEYLRDTVVKLLAKQEVECNAQDLVIGEAYKRINISGDGSYSDRTLILDRVFKTYAVFKEKKDNYEVYFSLIKIFEKVEAASKSFDSVQELVDNSLCYYLDDDVISMAISNQINKHIEPRFFSTDRQDSYKTFYLKNNVCKLYCFEMFRDISVSFDYVRDSEADNIGEYRIFGTPLDIPYILAKAKAKSIEKVTLDQVLDNLQEAGNLCLQILDSVEESKMVSSDYIQDRREKVMQNIYLLRSNRDQIRERLEKAE